MYTCYSVFSVSGMPAMDSQTAVAVQSLIESQTPVDQPAVEEEDIFQCGKCKKQFSSLMLFMNHKQTRCTGLRPIQPNVSTLPVSTVSSSLMTTISGGRVTQLTQVWCYSNIWHIRLVYEKFPIWLWISFRCLFNFVYGHLEIPICLRKK